MTNRDMPELTTARDLPRESEVTISHQHSRPNLSVSLAFAFRRHTYTGRAQSKTVSAPESDVFVSTNYPSLSSRFANIASQDGGRCYIVACRVVLKS